MPLSGTGGTFVGDVHARQLWAGEFFAHGVPCLVLGLLCGP